MNTDSDTISISPNALFAVWEAPECPVRIEFPVAVMDEMRAAVVDAYYSVPRGGVEIGGVLFGKNERGCVRIESWRQIPCEYATGPSFSLSDNDREGLTRLLGESKLEPVGWFHSHTRSEIRLTPADIELYDRFFPGKRQIALVLRPGHLQATRAGFFFRDAGGRIETEASCREFVADAASLAEMAALKTAPARLPDEPRRNTWIAGLLFAMLAGAGAFAARSYWCPADSSFPVMEMRVPAPARADGQLAAEKRIVDELERQAEKMREELLDEQLRNRKLERSVRFLRQRLSRQ